MSLQPKVISLVLAVFVAYGAFDYGIQRFLILPSFQTLEREEALSDMDRAAQAIHGEIQHLTEFATDWATWDDTYQFAQDHNSAYRNANLNIEALKNLQVNLLYIFDAARKPIWGMVYDFTAKKMISLVAFPEAGLSEGHPLLSFPNEKSTTRGLLLTEHGPMLITAKPVLTSAGAGPMRGAVILGRFLDADATAAIAQQVRVQWAVSALDGRALDAEQASAVAELSGSGKSLLREDKKTNQVYRILPDIFGHPALLLRVDVPKAISVYGQQATRYAMLSLLAAGLIMMFVLAAGLRYLVIIPIRYLTQQVVEVGQHGELAAPLRLSRHDEFGVLTRGLEQMVERLAAARKTLIDQSYQSGVAEMASGVLHNIGNAVTPLKVRVATVESAIRDVPSAELQMALDELANPDTQPSRRSDLEQFVNLAGCEIVMTLDKVTAQVAGIARQVEHVQKIISDQERFSRAARVMEASPIVDLALESVDLLSDGVRREFHIELDASLAVVGAVWGSRVAVQQILVNLLKNAAEAIRARALPPGAGRIIVDAYVEPNESHPMVHLRICDNGVGIPPENASRLFERGFSTKSRSSSGLGLHWCAITVAAMGGTLHAESAGVGQGACLHLLLPQVERPLEPPVATIET